MKEQTDKGSIYSSIMAWYIDNYTTEIVPRKVYNIRLLTESEGYIDNCTTSAEGTSGTISICPEHEVSNCIIHRRTTRTLATILQFSIASFWSKLTHKNTFCI